VLGITTRAPPVGTWVIHDSPAACAARGRKPTFYLPFYYFYLVALIHLCRFRIRFGLIYFVATGNISSSRDNLYSGFLSSSIK